MRATRNEITKSCGWILGNLQQFLAIGLPYLWRWGVGPIIAQHCSFSLPSILSWKRVTIGTDLTAITGFLLSLSLSLHYFNSWMNWLMFWIWFTFTLICMNSLRGFMFKTLISDSLTNDLCQLIVECCPLFFF